MIARLLKKNNKYCCSECMMIQQEIKSYCSFCGEAFTNYEEELVKIFKLEEPNDYN